MWQWWQCGQCCKREMYEEIGLIPRKEMVGGERDMMAEDVDATVLVAPKPAPIEHPQRDPCSGTSSWISAGSNYDLTDEMTPPPAHEILVASNGEANGPTKPKPESFTLTVDREGPAKLGLLLDAMNFRPYQIVMGIIRQGAVHAHNAKGGATVNVGDLISAVKVGGMKVVGDTREAGDSFRACFADGGPTTLYIHRCLWRVTVRRAADPHQLLGLSLRRCGSYAEVIAAPDGVVHEFNLGNPAAAIAKHDIVVSVNEKCSYREIASEIQHAPELRICVVRAPEMISQG